jgi:hypothetical protein
MTERLKRCHSAVFNAQMIADEIKAQPKEMNLTKNMRQPNLIP